MIRIDFHSGAWVYRWRYHDTTVTHCLDTYYDIRLERLFRVPEFTTNWKDTGLLLVSVLTWGLKDWVETTTLKSETDKYNLFREDALIISDTPYGIRRHLPKVVPRNSRKNPNTLSLSRCLVDVLGEFAVSSLREYYDSVL